MSVSRGSKFSTTLRHQLSVGAAVLPTNSIVGQQQQYADTSTAVRPFATLRRKRPVYQLYNVETLGSGLSSSGGLSTPFEYSGENVDEYSKKATLSPWTPVPDSVARRMLDMAQIQEDDIHVELGSGDGRVNFFAIEYGAQQSIGIDVDEDIVKVANDRLVRIHPQPNIEFIVADLMDASHPAWKYLETATVITMYFAKEGLTKLKPLLEERLRGKQCKIFTCGYTMPGWDYQMAETVLDIPIHFYDWGNDKVDNFFVDKMIDRIPQDYEAAQMDQFLQKKSSNFTPDLLLGYHHDDLLDADAAWDDLNDADGTEVVEAAEVKEEPAAKSAAEKMSLEDFGWKPNK